MNPNDISKTSFSTPHGQFEFLRMPHGLSNSACTFKRVMNCILSGLQYETVRVYSDDLIVFGSDYDKHLQWLEEVLRRLRKANLKLSPSKCHFETQGKISWSCCVSWRNKT